MAKKILGFTLFSIVLAIGSAKIRMPSFDNFFLDWHQILSAAQPPSHPLLLIDITEILDGPQKNYVTETRLREIIGSIQEGAPKSIGLTISINEIANSKDTTSRLANDKNFSKLWFFTNSTIFEKDSFSQFSDVIPDEKQKYFILTYDSLYDKVSRRILVFLGKNTTNSDAEMISNLVGKSVNPKEFSGTFEYLDSQQVFMKLWPRESWQIKKPRTIAELKEISAQAKDKVVLVGTLGRYSFNASPGIHGRMHLMADSNIEKEMIGAHELLANYILNWYAGDYIKSPNSTVKRGMIFLGIILVVGAVIFAPLRMAWALSSGFLVIYMLASYLIFKIFSIEFDSVRVLIIGIVSQYFIMPLRFHRAVTKQDREKYQNEKVALEERLKARVMVQAAAADAHQRVAAKISHDIRGPLTALQVVRNLWVMVFQRMPKIYFQMLWPGLIIWPKAH